jgi:two-component system cell cycle response regulator DivK
MKKPVLIVEDNEDVRDLYEDVLRREGYFVLTASDGAEALKLLSHSVRPGLILLDLSMPGMTGWAFLEAKKKNSTLAQLPVAVISAVNDIFKVNDAHEVLRKPVDLMQLLRIVNKYCLIPEAPQPLAEQTL